MFSATQEQMETITNEGEVAKANLILEEAMEYKLSRNENLPLEKS